jgi:hypothetical protein
MWTPPAYEKQFTNRARREEVKKSEVIFDATIFEWKYVEIYYYHYSKIRVLNKKQIYGHYENVTSFHVYFS